MPGGKLQDILEIRAPPRIDALRVVAYDHDVSVPPGNRVDQLRLNAVGVLIFVHENVTELVSDSISATSFRRLKKFQRLRKKIVEIHRVCFLLACFVDDLARARSARKVEQSKGISSEAPAGRKRRCSPNS